jgi:hypothetical protein
MRGGARPNSGSKGYGKTEQIRQQFDKFSPLFWQLMEEMAKSKIKEDKKFFITEFNKIQTKMIPQTLQGDEEGGAIQIKVINYGDNPPVSVHAEGLPASSSSGVGFRLQEDNSGLA